MQDAFEKIDGQKLATLLRLVQSWDSSECLYVGGNLT